jgi:hypothetical protein
MAIVQTWKFNEEISEANLLGMLCFSYDTFDLKPILNIEISLTKKPSYLPEELGGSFTLVEKINILKTLHSKLKTNDQNLKKLEIRPIYSHDNTIKLITYFIREEDTDDFMEGYINMASLIREFVTQPQEEVRQESGAEAEYKDDWKLDPEFIKVAKLIARPGEEVKDKNFLMKVPCYCWDLPVRNTYTEQIAVDLVSLYLGVCTDEEHWKLIEQSTYLRFMMYQDTAEGSPYVYGYIQEIANCTYPSHKEVLTMARARGNHLPCEITFAKRGFFYEFSAEEWKKKVIEHIGSFA